MARNSAAALSHHDRFPRKSAALSKSRDKTIENTIKLQITPGEKDEKLLFKVPEEYVIWCNEVREPKGWWRQRKKNN